MKKKISVRIFAILLVYTGLLACQNMDKTGQSQLDSALVGSDSLRMKDSLKAVNDVAMKSKVDGRGAPGLGELDCTKT